MLTSDGTTWRTIAFRAVSETITEMDTHNYFDFKGTLNILLLRPFLSALNVLLYHIGKCNYKEVDSPAPISTLNK